MNNIQIRKLPYCNYPTSADIHAHGIQSLPEILPLMDMDAAKLYRSSIYRTVVIDSFHPGQVVLLTKMIARSFAANEPMARHIQPPRFPPADLFIAKHRDPYGEEGFGEWTKENIIYWVIRLFILTNPSCPIDNIASNKYLLAHSLAIMNDTGELTGGAFNLPLSLSDIEQAPRNNDYFMDAAYGFFRPVHQLLVAQETDALHHLCEHYADFKTALQTGKAGIFFMIARSPSLPTEDAFELVAASIERFIALGYEYVVTAAANQWTGAAFELIGAVRVHFAPYRREKKLKESKEGLLNEPSSKDGYLSDKDSGCMFYILRLK